MKKPKFEYNITSRVLTITDAAGQQMRISGVTQQQAEIFAAKHGEAFISRGFRLQTSGSGDFTRREVRSA